MTRSESACGIWVCGRRRIFAAISNAPEVANSQHVQGLYVAWNQLSNKRIFSDSLSPWERAGVRVLFVFSCE
jgi:hypothetical protein